MSAKAVNVSPEFDSAIKTDISQIITEIDKLSRNSQDKIVRKLVVITGGEPMLQPIEKICRKLIKLNYEIQIETNGTIMKKIPKAVKIICSPKNLHGKYFNIRPDLLVKINAFKFLVSASNLNYSSIPKFVENNSNIAVFVQPIDEYDVIKNQANLDLALRLCEENGYFISLQIHKILNIR